MVLARARIAHLSATATTASAYVAAAAAADQRVRAIINLHLNERWLAFERLAKPRERATFFFRIAACAASRDIVAIANINITPTSARTRVPAQVCARKNYIRVTYAHLTPLLRKCISASRFFSQGCRCCRCCCCRCASVFNSKKECDACIDPFAAEWHCFARGHVAALLDDANGSRGGVFRRARVHHSS